MISSSEGCVLALVSEESMTSSGLVWACSLYFEDAAKVPGLHLAWKFLIAQASGQSCASQPAHLQFA